VTVQDATYNYLAITFSFHLASGFVQQTVLDNIATALRGLLNPATWGSTASVDPLTAPANAWGNETTCGSPASPRSSRTSAASTTSPRGP
jgi:hypothetical protein